MRRSRCCFDAFCAKRWVYYFFSFFSLLELMAPRRPAWACFSATRPIWTFLHRKVCGALYTKQDVYCSKYCSNVDFAKLVSGTLKKFGYAR